MAKLTQKDNSPDSASLRTGAVDDECVAAISCDLFPN